MPSEQELADYFSGAMPEAERAAFEEQMLADPAAMRELVEQRQLHTALKALLDPRQERMEAAILTRVRGMSDEAVVKKVLAHTTQQARPAKQHAAAGKIQRPQSITGSGGRWWTAVQALFSVGAAIAAVLLLMFRSSWFPRPTEPANVDSGTVVAQVRDDSGARWGARQRPLRWGDELRRESLVLDSGVVELAFRNGATLVAEGPARLDLAGAGHVILHQGKVSAKVPASAVGFTIDTAAGKVIDRGTRFGVKATPSGLVETHVFEGRVDVTPSSLFKSPMKPLRRDMAVRLDPRSSALASIASDAREFPRPGQIVGTPLVSGDFEDIAKVGGEGMPTAVTTWGGDSCEIVRRFEGVAPHAGDRMLRFIATGESADSDVWSASEQWQFVDLAPYGDAISNGVTAELSAWFNRIGSEQAVNEFVVVLAAYRGTPEDVKNLWWGHRPEMALAYSQDTIVTDEDPNTWERDEVRFEVPAGANLLLVSIAAAKSNPTEKLSGHFADSVSLRLVIPPSAAVHAQR